MSSESQKHIWEKIQRTAEKGLEVVAKLPSALRRARREYTFRTHVDAESEQRAQEMAQAFSTEFLDFVVPEAPTILAPLYPREGQLALFLLLKNRAIQFKEPTTTVGTYPPTGEYFVGKTYEAGARQDAAGSAPRLGDAPYVSFHTNWSIDRDFPLSCDIYGTVGNTTDSLKRLRFIFFENFPTEEDVLRVIGSYPGENVSVRMRKNGDTLEIRHEEVQSGEKVVYSTQYYRLESFEGGNTGKKYIVYGTNEGSDTIRQSKKQRATDPETGLNPAHSRA